MLTEFPAYARTRGGGIGLAVLLATIGLTAALVLRSGARAWGPKVRAWADFCPATPHYLLLATAAGSSNVRHLLLAFPLMWPFPEVAATTSERRFRVVLTAVLAIVGLAMQRVWVNKHLTARTQLAWYP